MCKLNAESGKKSNRQRAREANTGVALLCLFVKERERERVRQTDRQRQTDRDRETEREADRQRETDI